MTSSLVLVFAQFQITLFYRPGSKNTKVDASSLLHVAEPQADNEECILLPFCVMGSIELFLDQAIANTHQERILPSCLLNKLFVPASLRTRLITLTQTSIATGHLRTQCTYHLLRDKYWWPNMLADVHRTISSCSTKPKCLELYLPVNSTIFYYQYLNGPGCRLPH